MMTEKQWEQKLNIQTSGLDASGADLHHNRYEPTPYPVLERLVAGGHVRPESIWIDYGCGKGRVSFFLNHQTGCRVIGVEYDEAIFAEAGRNLRAYGRPGVEFVCANAELYSIEQADHFYFFNPFSVEILRAVLRKMMASYYEDPRVMRLYFYYPQDPYLAELMTSDLTFVEEIDCRDLFPGKDDRERILVFELRSEANTTNGKY